MEPVVFNQIITELTDCSSAHMVDTLYQTQLIKDALEIIFSFQKNMKLVFIGRIYNDMPYTKIAQQLSISENSAKVLFYRAKLLLRKKLRGEYHYEV